MTGFPTSQWPTLELRPRRSPFVRGSELRDDGLRMMIIVIGLASASIALLPDLLTGDLGGVAALAAPAAVVIAVAFGVTRRLRLRVASAAIESVGMFRTRRVGRGDVIGVVRVPITSAGMHDGAHDLLVDAQGRCLLRIRGRFWQDGDLDRAWAHAGLGIQLAGRPMTPKELEAWIPGSTRYIERRPFVFALGLAAALVALTVIATIVAVAVAPTAP